MLQVCYIIITVLIQKGMIFIMNNKFNRVLACTMAAVAISSASVIPANTVIAYAPQPDTVFVAAEGVSINKSAITIGKGETYSLISEVLPLTATSKNLLWMTSDPSVASVDRNGKVTAKGVGNATISAITHNGKKAMCYVTVNEAPSEVKLNIHSLEMGVGETYRFYATVPANTTACVRSYSSSDESIVSFDRNGVMTAKKAGTATISVKIYNGKTDTCQITVKNAPSSVALTTKSLTLNPNDKYTLHAAVPENTASRVRVYSSDNSNIVECDTKGNLTAKKEGTANITVTTCNGKTDTCKVTVKKAPDSVTLKQTAVELDIDDTSRVIYSLPSNSYTSKITFTSSDRNVAEVDIKGIITAKNPGTADITVRTANGKTAVMKVTVNEPVQIYPWSSSDDILNSAKLNPVKTNSKMLDDKIDSIFGDILNSRMSNAHKVKACFDYLATNINYAYISYDYSPVYGINYASYNDREIVISAYSTLVKKYGNCYDYACTLAAVMQRIGYDAHVVHGLVGMSAGGYGNHYWVDTNINGRHHIFDAQVENNNLGWGGYVNHYFYCLDPNSTSMYIYQETWSTSNFRTY